jgi:hypothetical protein
VTAPTSHLCYPQGTRLNRYLGPVPDHHPPLPGPGRWAFVRPSRSFSEQDALQLREADARLNQRVLKPQQGPQQRDQPLLLGGIQAPLLGLADQLLELGVLELDPRRFFHRHSRSRKSLASG